jgi:RNA polymerase sigma-70 factor (ECF subfamily)
MPLAARQAEPDTALLDRARAGEAHAFEEIVREHQAMVFSIAYRATRDRSVAEEVAQDVFFELSRNLARIESPAHLVHWLRRVSSHRCIDWCRRNRLAVQAPAVEPDPPAAAPSPDVLFQHRLWTLVGALAPAARLVVILRYQEDLDPSDIANVLGMPVNTVKSHLRRSIAVLREGLEATNRGVR